MEDQFIVSLFVKASTTVIFENVAYFLFSYLQPCQNQQIQPSYLQGRFQLC